MKKTLKMRQFLNETNKTTKRFSIALFISVLLFLATCFTGVFPTAYAYMVPAMAHKDFNGSFYSLKPSRYSSPKEGSSNKYYYTLVDEGNSDPSLQYFIERDNEVYLFEYYAYLNEQITASQDNSKTKVAVYSKSQLEFDPKVNMYKEKGANNQLYYKNVTDYLFFGIKKFNPNWELQSTPLYSSTQGVSNRDSSYDDYYAYEYYDGDKADYQRFDDIDVSTQYKFNIDDLGIKYDATYTDQGNFQIGDGSNEEVQYISPENDNGLGVFVLNRIGGRHVTVDINGNQIGNSKGQSYYKGGQFYIYNNNIKGNDNEIINGFEVYSLVNAESTTYETIRPGASFKPLDAGKKYSIFVFENETTNPLIEAVRYYDHYKIDYEIVDVPEETTLIDATDDQLIASNPRVEIVDKHPSKFLFGYEYYYKYNVNQLFKVYYKEKEFRYFREDINKSDEVIYELKLEKSNVTSLPAGTKDISSFATDAQGASSNNYETITITKLNKYSELVDQRSLLLFSFDGGYKKSSETVTLDQTYYDYSLVNGSYVTESNNSSLQDLYSSSVNYLGAGAGLSLTRNRVNSYYIGGKNYKDYKMEDIPDTPETGYDVYKYTVDYNPKWLTGAHSPDTNSGHHDRVTSMTTGAYLEDNGWSSVYGKEYHNNCFYKVKIAVTSNNPGNSYADWDTSGKTHLYDSSIKSKLTSQVNTMISSGSSSSTFNFKVGHSPNFWDKWTGYTISFERIWSDTTGEPWNSEAFYNNYIHSVSDIYWNGIKDKTAFTSGAFIGIARFGSVRNLYNLKDYRLDIKTVEKVYANPVRFDEIPSDYRHTEKDCISGLANFSNGSINIPYQKQSYSTNVTGKVGYYYVKSDKMASRPADCAYRYTFYNEIKLTPKTRQITAPSISRTLGSYNSRNSYEMGEFANLPLSNISEQIVGGTTLSGFTNVSGLTMLPMADTLKRVQDIYRQEMTRPSTLKFTIPSVTIGGFYSYETATDTNVAGVKTANLVINDGNVYEIKNSVTSSRTYYNLYYVSVTGDSNWDTVNRNVVPCEGTTIPGDRNNVQPIVSSDNRKVTIKHSYYHSQRSHVELVDKNTPLVSEDSDQKFIPKYRDPRIQDKWYNKSYPQYELVKVENNTPQDKKFNFLKPVSTYPAGNYNNLNEAWNGHRKSASDVRELIKADLESRGHVFLEEKLTIDSTPDKVAADYNSEANVGVKMYNGSTLYNAKRIEHKFSQIASAPTKALASDLLSSNRTNSYVKYRAKNGAFLDASMTFNDFVLEYESMSFLNSTANIFNEADFFKRHVDSNKYLRIEGDANNKVYITKEPITIIKLPSNAYASYYLDGQFKNIGHVGNSFTIPAGKISKIMITKDNTTDPGRYMTYSKFVSLSLAKGSDGDNNYFEHKLKLNRSKLSETRQTYVHTDIKINTYLKENKDNLSKILGSAVYVKDPETGVWNINFPNIDWTSAGVEQYIDLSKHINGQSIMDYRAGIKNYGSKDAPFTINAELAKKLQVPADSKVFFTKLDGERRNVFFKFNVTTAISSRTTSNDFINVNKSLTTNVPSAYDKVNYEYAGTAINFFNAMIPGNHSTTYQGPDSVMVDLNANYKGVYVTRGVNNVQDVLARIQQIKNINGTVSRDYFVINNNGVYKLIRIKGDKYSKYKVYRDLHKTKHPNGEITYNDEGFNMPITDLATITDFNELNGVTVNTATGKYTPPVITMNNAFDNINVYDNLITVKDTTIGRHPISNDSYNEVDPNRYNLYERNDRASRIVLDEIQSLLYLAKESIRDDVNNDYVTPDKQARYRIVFDNEPFINGASIASLINNKLKVDDYRKVTNNLVDTFELTGQWEKYNVLDEYINAHPELFKKYTLPQGYNVPYFIDPTSIYQFSGTSTITESSMFIYRIKLKADGITIPSNLAGKWVVENPRISGTTYDQGGTINPKSFNEDFVNAVTENRLFKGMNNYLLLNDKIDLYRLKTKREYKAIINTTTEKKVDNKAYDLRTQLGTKYFKSINDTEDKIVFFYGDDMLMKDGTTYKGVNVNFRTPDYENLATKVKNKTLEYNRLADKTYIGSILYDTNLKVNNVLRTYNGYLTDDPKLGGLRAGYYYNTIEKLYYEDKVYHLGSIVNSNKTQDYVDALRNPSIYEEAVVPGGIAILKQLVLLLDKYIEYDGTRGFRGYLPYTLINDMYTDNSWGASSEEISLIKSLINSDVFSIELNLDRSLTKRDVEKLLNVWRNCQNKLRGPSEAELSSLPESVKNLLTIKVDERVTSDGRSTNYVIYNNKIYYEYCDAKNYTSGVGVAIDDYVDANGVQLSKLPYITRPKNTNDNIGFSGASYKKVAAEVNRFVYIHDFSTVNPRFDKTRDLNDPYINWISENEIHNLTLQRKGVIPKVLSSVDEQIVYDPTRYIPIKSVKDNVASYDYRNVAGLFLSVGKLQNSYNTNAPLIKASAVLTEIGSNESPYCTMNLYDSLNGGTNGYILSEVNNDNYEHLREFAQNIMRSKESESENRIQDPLEGGYDIHGLIDNYILANEPFAFSKDPESRAQFIANSSVLHNKLNTIYSIDKDQLLDYNKNVTEGNIKAPNAPNIHDKSLVGKLDLQFYNLNEDFANFPYFGGGYNSHFDNFPYSCTSGYLDEIVLDGARDEKGNHLDARKNEKRVELKESTIYNISSIKASRQVDESSTSGNVASSRKASFIVTREKDDITVTNLTPKFSVKEFSYYGYTADTNSFILYASSSGRVVSTVENNSTITTHKVQKSLPIMSVSRTLNKNASEAKESVIYETISYTNEKLYSNYYRYYDRNGNIKYENSDKNIYNDGRIDFEYKSLKDASNSAYLAVGSNTLIKFNVYSDKHLHGCKIDSTIFAKNFEETTYYKSIRLGVTPDDTLNTNEIKLSTSYISKWNDGRLTLPYDVDFEMGMSADNKQSIVKLEPRPNENFNELPEAVSFGYTLSYPEKVDDYIYPKLPNYHLRNGRYYYEDPDATFHEGNKNYIIIMTKDSTSDLFYKVPLESSLPYKIELESYTNGSFIKAREQIMKIDLSKGENSYLGKYNSLIGEYMLSDKLRVVSEGTYLTSGGKTGVIKGETVHFISPVVYEKNPYNLGNGKQENPKIMPEGDYELYKIDATYGAEWFKEDEFNISQQNQQVKTLRNGVYFSGKADDISTTIRKEYAQNKIGTRLSITHATDTANAKDSVDENSRYSKKSKEYFSIDDSGKTKLVDVYNYGAYIIMRELNTFFLSNLGQQLRTIRELKSHVSNNSAYFYTNGKQLGEGREVYAYFAFGAYSRSSIYSRFKITISEASTYNSSAIIDEANGSFSYVNATAGRDGYWKKQGGEEKTIEINGLDQITATKFYHDLITKPEAGSNIKKKDLPEYSLDGEGYVARYESVNFYRQSIKYDDGTILDAHDSTTTAYAYTYINFKGYKKLTLSNFSYVKNVTEAEISKSSGAFKYYGERELIDMLNKYSTNIKDPKSYIDIYNLGTISSSKTSSSETKTYYFYRYVGPKEAEIPKTDLLGDTVINQYNYLDKNIVNFLFGKTAQDHPIKSAIQKDVYSYIRPGASFISNRASTFAVIDESGRVHASFRSALTDSIKQNLININTYEFSRRYLMQRYTPDDNVTGITFRVVRADTNEPVIQSGVVAQIYSKVNGTKENVTFDAQTGIFTYKFSPQDLREYNKMGPNGRIYTPESFVKDYLLNNNLEFGFKNLFSQNDTNIDFNIQYDSFFERKNFYFDYNQNGKYDGNVKLDKPYYDINGKKVINEEQNFFTVSQLNDAYGLINGKKPAMFDSPLGLWKTATFSVKGKTGTALRTTPIVGGNFVYLRLYDSGESHIVE